MLQGREFLPLQAGGDIFSQEAFLYSKKKKKKITPCPEDG